jgi:ABC-2 type transport system permease protein
MNPTAHAVRVGLRRGWIETLLSLRSAQDQSFNLVMALGVVAWLWFNRDGTVEGTSIPETSFAMPSILAGLLAFGCVTGPAYTLALEREDGTLLRMKAVPRGMVGYVAGGLLVAIVGLIPMLAVILVPAGLLFDDVVPSDPGGWLGMVGMLLLGMMATMPIGVLVGALVPNIQKVSTWGMVPTLGLAAISGIFFPIDRLWGWLQGVAQVFPMYWLGLGMRAAFLPESAAAAELGGSWRTGQTVAVLIAWAIAGAVVTPPVLRRMARRQSGAAVAAAREAAAQWIR